MSTAAAPPRDPARQPERTRLSWRRTVLAATVVLLLAVRLGVQERPTAIQALSVTAALAGWLAMLVFSWRRISALAAARPAPPRWVLPVTVLVTVGFAGLGIALVELPH